LTTLHLGVNDVPYGFTADRGRSKTGRQRASTTGDVAEILEDKYHVMQVFFALHEGDVVAAMGESLQGSLESLLMGRPQGVSPPAAGEAEVQALFQRFLSDGEMERLGIPGVPTGAALKGVNHRRKHPYAKSNPSRPSFVDTGLFQSSFRAWVTE
jgi:hypothetical protein